MSSPGYQLQAGSYLPGGGASASTQYILNGAVPVPASAGSSGPSNIVRVGTPLMLYTGLTGVSLAYDGSSVETLIPGQHVLKVGYSGGSGTVSGFFYYRLGGASSYTSAVMQAGTGDTLTYTVQQAQITVRGLEYYFSVSRGNSVSSVGSAASPYTIRAQLSNAQAQRPTATPSSSYRMIGLPLQISGSNSVVNVFSDDLGTPDPNSWRLGRYDPINEVVDEYPSAPTVSPGRAYWLITRNGDTYGADGLSIIPNRTVGGSRYYEIALDSGWCQMANPLPFNVIWDNVRIQYLATVLAPGDHPDSLLEDSAYSYNGSAYQTTQTLTAWNGVFVHVNRDNITALVPYQEGTAAKLAAEFVDVHSGMDHWNLHLKLIENDFVDDGNFIGVRQDALDGRDKYDFSEPPPAPGAPQLGFRIPDDGERLRRSDYRPPLEAGATWEIVFKSVGGQSRKLVIDDMGQLPVNYEAFIILDNGKRINLSQHHEIDIPNSINSAKIVIGKADYTAGEIASILPKEYQLEQNYPNPFNPQTTIEFALPDVGQVELEVYNVLGQKVKTLLNQQLPAGYHSVNWDGTDGSGLKVASGVYFYRLAADTFNSYRKMLLVK